MQGWHLLSRNQHQDRLSNGSSGQSKQDLLKQHHKLRKQVNSILFYVREHCLLTTRRGSRLSKPKCLRKRLRIAYLEHKTNDWVRGKMHFLVGPQHPLLAALKRQTWFGHVTHNDSLSKTIFRAPWRVGDAVVGRGNAGWTTSKSGHQSPCQKSSQGPPAEKTGRGSLLNRLSCPHDDQIGQGTELKCSALKRPSVVDMTLLSKMNKSIRRMERVLSQSTSCYISTTRMTLR